MSLFQRKAEEKRSIEEILTPKSESEEITDEFLEEISEEEDFVEDIEIKEQSSEDFTKNALNCFGWKEHSTEKWMIKCARVWYALALFAWFLFGAFTFAPIVFISNKVNVIFKSKKKSIFVSIGVYSLVLALIVFLIIARNINNVITP